MLALLLQRLTEAELQLRRQLSLRRRQAALDMGDCSGGIVGGQRRARQAEAGRRLPLAAGRLLQAAGVERLRLLPVARFAERLASPERRLGRVLICRGSLRRLAKGSAGRGVIGQVVKRGAELHRHLVGQVARWLQRRRLAIALGRGGVLLLRQELLAGQKERLGGIGAFRMVRRQPLKLCRGAIRLLEFHVVPGQVVARLLGEGA